MKKIRNNLCYFEISKKNQEKLLDDFYVFGEKHPDLNKYIKNTKEIKRFLRNNPNNYWVNTAGFENLIFDLRCGSG